MLVTARGAVGAPACVNVYVNPPIVKVATRAIPVFAVEVTMMFVVPVPLATERVAHVAVFVVVHPQVLPLVVKPIVFVPPPATTMPDDVDNANVQDANKPLGVLRALSNVAGSPTATIRMTYVCPAGTAHSGVTSANRN